MKYLSLIAVGCLLAFGSCKKKVDCSLPTQMATAAETTDLETYIKANNISAVKDSRGFYYNILAPGGDAKPDNCSTVKVSYSGTLLNGSVFDSNPSASFPLNNLIVGWQEGIPLIGKTGKIVLYLPPSLAYGSTGKGTIPANSSLIFTIELQDF